MGDFIPFVVASRDAFLLKLTVRKRVSRRYYEQKKPDKFDCLRLELRAV